MVDKFQRFNSGRVNFFLLAIITVILVATVLKLTSSVVLPFTISVFLAIVTSPIVRFMEKFHIPRIIAILLIIILLAGVMAFFIMVIYSSGRSIIELYPRYEARLTEIYHLIARFFDLPYDEHLSFFENVWSQIGIRNQIRNVTISFSNTILSFLSNAVMVVIFMAFLLVEASFIKQKLNNAFLGTRVEQIKKISSDIMTQVTRYLSIKFIISVANGILVGIALKIIGVEFAIVWGVIQFVLNFIPNIGSIAIGVGATAFSLIQFWPEPGPIIATGLCMLGINMVLGSFIDPKVMGDNLGISPLIVLISLLIWGWLWGFTGLIIAVPMTAIVKIVCENIPVLEPISILLGSSKATMATPHSGDAA